MIPTIQDDVNLALKQNNLNSVLVKTSIYGDKRVRTAI